VDHWDVRCQAPYLEAGHDFPWATGEPEDVSALRREPPLQDAQRKVANPHPPELADAGREHVAQNLADARARRQAAVGEPHREFGDALGTRARQLCR